MKKALHFLNGNYAPILKELEEKMQQAAEEMEFEKAIEYRELLGSVKKIAQKQKITNSDMEDKDVIAMAKDREDAVVQVFFIRDGRLIGRDHFCLHIAADDKKEEILDEDIEKLIEERQAARKAKDFARADAIRDELLEKGIILKDTREGVQWKRA